VQKDVQNATFYCGSAEKAIPRLLKTKEFNYSTVSAVVNPGRGGLGNEGAVFQSLSSDRVMAVNSGISFFLPDVNVIHALRKTPQVDRVVYVSCMPVQNAMRNLIE
jgi:tRNA/tmRNA/rRNA uracil-C5-methylase (TrmA/RlmC/RlmD family)